MDGNARQPRAPRTHGKRRLERRRHRAAVRGSGERAEPAVGREDLEEEFELRRVDRRLHEAGGRRRAGPTVVSVELGLESPAIRGRHPLGGQAQHLPARPRALVEDALQPVGTDRQVAHLETVDRDLGVAPPAQEGTHTCEIGDRARHVGRWPRVAAVHHPRPSARVASQAASSARACSWRPRRRGWRRHW